MSIRTENAHKARALVSTCLVLKTVNMNTRNEATLDNQVGLAWRNRRTHTNRSQRHRKRDMERTSLMDSFAARQVEAWMNVKAA